MEELRSTDILDREILEEARRKAYKILKEVDESLQKSSEEWSKRSQTTIDEARQKQALRIEKVRHETFARLPLEKQRTRLKTLETLLNKAIAEYVHRIPQREIIELLEKTLKKQSIQCDQVDEIITVQAYHIQESEAVSIVEKVFLHKEIEKRPAAADFTPLFPSICLNTHQFRIIVSIDTLIQSVLEEHRAELIEALLGSSPVLSPA
ncbi:MAG: hypothetical protein LBQ77_02915 [Treponema sp.]|jgi:hypothetical protein|nr:hypothetical protein [Treponema sp.]